MRDTTVPLAPAGERRLAAAARDTRVEQMVELHFDIVWRTLRRLGVAESNLDDAAQQVFIVATRKLDIIDPAGEKAYLLGVAVRVASDSRRSWARRREAPEAVDVETSDPRPSPEDLLDQKRARQQLDQILASMPMDLRAAFTLFEIEGMTVPEVAAAVEVPVGTAASRLRRARELFHELVRKLGRPHGGHRV